MPVKPLYTYHGSGWSKRLHKSLRTLYPGMCSIAFHHITSLNRTLLRWNEKGSIHRSQWSSYRINDSALHIISPVQTFLRPGCLYIHMQDPLFYRDSNTSEILMTSYNLSVYNVEKFSLDEQALGDWTAYWTCSLYSLYQFLFSWLQLKLLVRQLSTPSPMLQPQLAVRLSTLTDLPYRLVKVSRWLSQLERRSTWVSHRRFDYVINNWLRFLADGDILFGNQTGGWAGPLFTIS